MPTASRILYVDEFKSGQFSEVQGSSLDAYTTQLEISGQAGVVLSGITEEGSYDKSRLYSTVKPLPDIAWAVTQLTTEQQSYLDNIYMGWLSGLDQFGDNAILVKGMCLCVSMCMYVCVYDYVCMYNTLHYRLHGQHQ